MGHKWAKRGFSSTDDKETFIGVGVRLETRRMLQLLLQLLHVAVAGAGGTQALKAPMGTLLPWEKPHAPWGPGLCGWAAVGLGHDLVLLPCWNKDSCRGPSKEVTNFETNFYGNIHHLRCWLAFSCSYWVIQLVNYQWRMDDHSACVPQGRGYQGVSRETFAGKEFWKNSWEGNCMQLT